MQAVPTLSRAAGLNGFTKYPANGQAGVAIAGVSICSNYKKLDVAGDVAIFVPVDSVRIQQGE